jgi:separase
MLVCDWTCISDYLVASMELAHQFVKLGKVRRAISIYSQALNKTRNTSVSGELRVHLLLRHAEALAMLDNISKR